MDWMIRHLHVIVLLAAVAFLVYFPPRLLSKFGGLGDFISRHWGDSIGFYFVHLGVALIIAGDLNGVLKDTIRIGDSFILLGVGILKMKYIPKNGTPNGVSPPTPGSETKSLT